MSWLARKWSEQRQALSRKGAWSGYLLGFALSGFFDGILLHQVLQWHHLLLGVEWKPLQNMRAQILADGVFHLLMYAVAVSGLWSLWRARHSPDLMQGRTLSSHVLIGFGVWHVLDAVVSHWLLGIHRIKMDSPNPLLWDLVWLALFGIVPLVIGGLMSRKAQGRASPPRQTVTAALVLAVIVAAPIATLPPSDNAQVLVLVRPSQTNTLLDGLEAVSGRIVWADRSAALWVFSLDDTERARELYEHGALFVTRSPAILGCLAWTRT